ncbi:MAG: glycosyltransferase, partial [Planctomycetota bacterium]
MLRCLQILSSVKLEAGGVARCVIDLCEGLAQHGVATTLATAEADDVPEAWRAAEPPADTPRCVVYDPARPLDTLGPLIAEHDVVHLHVPWDRLNPAVAAACDKAHTPYAISVHGMLDDWSMAQKGLKKRAYWWLTARKLLNHAAFVHTTARAEADQASKWF